MMHVEEKTGDQLLWRRSSFCSHGACLEVAFVGDTVVIRDSKNPDQQTLTYVKSEWQAFIAAVKDGKFDF